MCLNIGTPNNHHFPFGTNGKVAVLGVPILKHFRVNKFLAHPNAYGYNGIEHWNTILQTKNQKILLQQEKFQ